MELKVYREDPTFEQALKFAAGLGVGSDGNDEYERGVVEFIIDLFAVEDGMDARDTVLALIQERLIPGDPLAVHQK